MNAQPPVYYFKAELSHYLNSFHGFGPKHAMVLDVISMADLLHRCTIDLERKIDELNAIEPGLGNPLPFNIQVQRERMVKNYSITLQTTNFEKFSQSELVETHSKLAEFIEVTIKSIEARMATLEARSSTV